MNSSAVQDPGEPTVNQLVKGEPDDDELDFSQLYDIHHEYIARRNHESLEARQIILECIEFKIPNLLSVIPPSYPIQSVIEIGCATGDLLAAFPGKSANGRPIAKTGFDISPLNVAVASSRYGHIAFSADEFDNVPVADVVILSDVLEHVPDDRDFLRRASRVGRLVLINLPLEDNWLNRGRAYGKDDPSGHLRSYTLSAGLGLIEDAGLSVLHSRQLWSHESTYDIHRRKLRARHLGYAHSGSFLIRCGKSLTHGAARIIRPFGRRLFPSNLFVSACRTGEAAKR